MSYFFLDLQSLYKLNFKLYLSFSAFANWIFSYQQVDLDVTLPGEGGKDRPFKVSIKFVSRVSWHLLHEVLTGRTLPEPLELDKPISTNPVHAVDVVLRHLPSMKWVLLAFIPLYILNMKIFLLRISCAGLPWLTFISCIFWLFQLNGNRMHM